MFGRIISNLFRNTQRDDVTLALKKKEKFDFLQRIPLIMSTTNSTVTTCSRIRQGVVAAKLLFQKHISRCEYIHSFSQYGRFWDGLKRVEWRVRSTSYLSSLVLYPPHQLASDVANTMELISNSMKSTICCALVSNQW